LTLQFRFLLLVVGPVAAVDQAGLAGVVRSARSGPWSAATTWEGGKVPGAGSRVHIRTGHAVLFDTQSEAVIRSIKVAGVLSFAPYRDTRLEVGLVKIQLGDDYSEDGFDCDAHVPAGRAGGGAPQLSAAKTDADPLRGQHVQHMQKALEQMNVFVKKRKTRAFVVEPPR
jgi:hypothetical protein